MKAEWKNTREYGWCWTAHYGNIVSMSKISPEKCLAALKRKVIKAGYNTRKFQ